MNRIIYIIGLLLCFPLLVEAQYYSFSQHVRYADECYQNQHYLLALEHYNEASTLKGKLQKQSLYQYADAAYQLNALDLAESLFNTYLDYNKLDNEADVLYKLILIRQMQGRYEEAILDCNIYLSEFESIDSTWTKEVNLIRNSCQWVLAHDKEPIADSVQNLAHLNSPFSEQSPFLFNDSIYYNSIMKEYSFDKQKSYISRIYDESGREIEFSDLPEDKFISHPSFSSDGKYFMYTVGAYDANRSLRCDIYFTLVSGDELPGISRKMPEPVNSELYSSTHPVVVQIDTTYYMYFSSNRPGGKGGFDIWKAELSSDMLVMNLENIESVNTEFDEFSPYLNFYTNDLYFSSNGHPGYGGFDVFKHDLGKDSMAIPENLGSVINTSYNDVFFRTNDNGSVVYFSSNRPGSQFLDSSFETCCYDIYKADVTECSINLIALIYDKATEEMLGGTSFYVIDAETRDTVYNSTSEENIFEVDLECEKEYVIESQKEGFDLHEMSFKPLNFSYGQENEIIRKIYLNPSIYDLDLTVLSKDTNLPLDSLDISLRNIQTGEVVHVNKHPSNNIHFDVLPASRYSIHVSRQGYRDTTEIVNTGARKSYIQKTVYLEEKEIIKKAKVSLSEAIPVALYFDHDAPKQGDSLHLSNMNYTESYDKYYDKRGRYIYNYVSKFSGSRQDDARREASQFFDREVKSGFEGYENFKNQLLLVLESGQNINIYIRGYASPIALDDYNKALGRRRVDSVRKEFDEWNDGVLLPYIKSGQLLVTERSFGEETSPSDVSDDPRQPFQSIYSPAASRERRVEIDEINFNENPNFLK